jgi:hypothetical protein
MGAWGDGITQLPTRNTGGWMDCRSRVGDAVCTHTRASARTCKARSPLQPTWNALHVTSVCVFTAVSPRNRSAFFSSRLAWA